ncbi:MAG: hypothetical protein ACK5NN_00190 [Sphingomonadaceae bacterium]
MATGLRTSLILTGDESGAARALSNLDQALDAGEAQARDLAKAYDDVDRSIKAVGTAQASAKLAADQTRAAYQAGEISQEQYNRELLETKTALNLVESEHRQVVNALKAAGQATQGATVSVGQARAGYQNLGRQVQDVAVMMQGGANLGTIVATQGGQIADAVAQMGGRFSGFAAFLAGPWGAAVIVAGSVLANFVSGLFDAEDAQGAATSSSYDFADGLDVLALQAGAASDAMDQLVSRIRGAIAVQGDFLRMNALVASQSAAALEQRMAANSAAVKNYEKRKGSMWAFLPFGGPGIAESLEAGKLRAQMKADGAALETARAAQANADIALSQRMALEAIDPKLAAENRYQEKIGALNQRFKKSRMNADDPLFRATNPDIYISQNDYQREVTRLTVERDRAVETASRSAGGTSRKTSGSSRSNGAAGREAREIARFGEKAAESIARINQRFSDQPKLVAQASAATADLDTIIADLAKRRPPNFEAMIADARTAKQVVEESLLRPFNDLIESAQKQEDIQRLILGGREDEATALRQIYQLQERVGVVTEDQRRTIWETVQAEQAINEQLAERDALISAYSASIGNVRSDLEGLLSGNMGAGSFLKSFKSNMQQLQGRLLTEQLFGPALRQLDEYVRQNTGIETGVDIMRAGTEKAGKAATSLADVLSETAGRIDKAFGGGADTPGSVSAQGMSAFDRAFAAVDGSSGRLNNENAAIADNTAEIVVSAQRMERSALALSPTEFFEKMSRDILTPALSVLDELLGVKFFAQMEGVLSGALQGYARAGEVGAMIGGAQGLMDDFGSQLLGEATSSAASRILGNALNGAQMGGQIAGIGKMLGLNSSTTGGQIGGALGSFVPVPGADVAGAILGSIVGGLFKKKKYGTALLTGADENGLSISGNNADRKDAAGSLAGQVQASLRNIAEAFGGDLGSFRTSIGMYKDNYRVSTTGYAGGKLNFKGSSANGLKDFGDDAEGAIAYAIADAISDGAITGISDKVEMALKRFTDIDKAMAEALKVQELEHLLAGPFGEIEKAFRTFERQAAERLRIARDYGFDIVAIEQKNAEDRLKLSQQLLEDQVGSLQALIEEMTFGSLFEGSAVDQRSALLAQVDQARADTQAGKEGAADTLANLLGQLNSVSRDVYGTTGGFANDRSAILDTARSAIASANARIAEAQARSDPALAQTNAALDENNDQNAQMLAALKEQSVWLSQIVSGSAAGTLDYSRLRELAAL